jgi:hypothetical protein
MRNQIRLRNGFALGMSAGVALSLLELIAFAARASQHTLEFFKALCAPTSWLAAKVADLLYTHNRIGPSRSEIIVFDIVLCVGTALLWGAVGTLIAAVMKRSKAVR